MTVFFNSNGAVFEFDAGPFVVISDNVVVEEIDHVLLYNRLNDKYILELFYEDDDVDWGTVSPTSYTQCKHLSLKQLKADLCPSDINNIMQVINRYNLIEKIKTL